MGDLATRVRAKFPGQYDDMNDSDLESKVLAKFPQYGDMAQSSAPPANMNSQWMDSAGVSSLAPTIPQQSDTAMQAQAIAPNPTTKHNFFDRVLGDIRYGGETTPAGKFLRAIGAKQGTYAGMSPEAADFVTSPITGTVRALKGQSQIATGHPLSGAYNTAAGALEAATIPSSFVAPEASAGISKLKMLIPSAERAGNAISQVEQTIGHVPIRTSGDTIAAVDRLKQLSDTGAKLPPVVNKFLDSINAGESIPFKKARDFYMNARDLSVEDKLGSNSRVKYQMTKFWRSLGQDIQQVADSGGQGEQFSNAMQEYAKAKGWAARGQVAKDLLVKTAIPAAASGIGAAAGYSIYKHLHDIASAK